MSGHEAFLVIDHLPRSHYVEITDLISGPNYRGRSLTNPRCIDVPLTIRYISIKLKQCANVTIDISWMQRG